MKRLLITLSLLFSSISIIFAQWSTGSTPTTPDNVGIGNTAPTSKLSINSNWGISGCTYTGVPAVKVMWGSPFLTTQLCNPMSNSVPNIMEIDNNTSGNTTPLFYLNSNGNLGIGTNNPISKINVVGTAEFKSSLSGNAFNLYNTRANTSGASNILNIGYTSTQNQNPSIIKAYGNVGNAIFDRFVVKNDGEVGIGVSNPTAKLCIAGGVVVDDGAKNNGTYSEYLIKFGSSTHGEAIGSQQTGSGNIFGLDFYTGYVQQMTITNSGKVKIGNVATPGDYKLYVEKGIMTEQVKVAIKTTGDWQDCVFKPEYKLMPLSQVEAYINENQHLPDVPSAEEVVKVGLNLGKMDATLLQKIEELTLYTIKLNKQVEALQQKISNLELKK